MILHRVQRRRAGNADHRRGFGIGTGDAGQRGQIADAVGDDQRAGAFHSGVAVGGVGGVQFIAVADKRQSVVAFQQLQQAEVIVAGHAVNTIDVQGVKLLQNE